MTPTDRPFWRFWAASAVSTTGDAVTLVALPLVALTVLGASALEVSLITAASYAAWLFLGLPAGVIVARLPLRITQVVLDLVRALLLLSIPVAVLLDRLTIAHMVVVALGVNCAGVVFAVGAMTYLPHLMPRDELPGRNSLMSGTYSVTQIGGPGLGGLLVQTLGAVVTLWVDVISYVVSACLLRSLPDPPRPAREAGARMREQIAEGWRFVTRHATMRPCLVDAVLVNFISAGLIALTPIYLIRELDASPFVVGVLIACDGLGAFIGALLASRAFRALGTARASLLAASTGAAVSLVMPLGDGAVGMTLFAVANIGFSAGCAVRGIAYMTHRQIDSPPEMLSRVLATTRSLSWSVTPLGALLAGVVATAWSPRAALWVLVLVGLACPFILLASKVARVRDLEETPREQAPAPGR